MDQAMQAIMEILSKLQPEEAKAVVKQLEDAMEPEQEEEVPAGQGTVSPMGGTGGVPVNG